MGADRAQNPGQGSYTVTGSAGWGGGGGQREHRGRRARPVNPGTPPARELRDLGGGWFGDDGRDAGAGSGNGARSGSDAGGAGELDWDLGRVLGGEGARCAALHGTVRLLFDLPLVKPHACKTDRAGRHNGQPWCLGIACHYALLPVLG